MASAWGSCELDCFGYCCVKLSFLFITRYVPAVVAVGQYFSQRLSFATGLRKVIKQNTIAPNTSLFPRALCDRVWCWNFCLRSHCLRSSRVGWMAGLQQGWSRFQYLFLFKFKYLSLVQVQIYLSCLDHQVMAAICSLGFLCGLALAPRARKPSRWWQDFRHFFAIAFVLGFDIRPVGVQCDF